MTVAPGSHIVYVRVRFDALVEMAESSCTEKVMLCVP
jgi:hypothetical protein